VDRYVADATGLSRSFVQKLISDGRLTADGEALRANTVVAPGTELHLDVPPPTSLDLAPAPTSRSRSCTRTPICSSSTSRGLVVHPAPGHSGDTLVNALLAHGSGDAWGGSRAYSARGSSTVSIATRAAC
jgi:23S rRNA pseudouridine1911/1915/1917 synthase